MKWGHLANQAHQVWVNLAFKARWGPKENQALLGSMANQDNPGNQGPQVLLALRPSPLAWGRFYPRWAQVWTA